MTPHHDAADLSDPALFECTTDKSGDEKQVTTFDSRQKAILFDTLLRYLPEHITIKDTQLRYLLVNHVWAHHHSVSNLQNACLKTDGDFHPADIAEKCARKDRQAIKNREPQIGAIEKMGDDGEHIKRVAMTRLPVIDPATDEVTALICISKDISTRTTIEKELAYERDMLHTLLDHSRDAIYFKDLESRYLRISRAHPAMKFLTTPAQAIGTTDFDYFSIEHAQQAFDDEKKIIATGEPLLGLIEHESGPGLPERWVFTSKLPMYDKNGIIIGTFGLSRDMTDIKRYENELYKSKQELERRVHERTRDLQSANTDLERRIAQLDFLTSASYEMAHCTEIKELAFVIMRCFNIRIHYAAAALCITTGDRFSCLGVTGIENTPSTRRLFENSIHNIQLANLRRATTVSDWHAYFPHTAEYRLLEPFSLLGLIPLLADNRLIGIVQLFSDTSLATLIDQEEKVLSTLAAHAAVGLSNAIHYKELGEKVQLQAELDAARSIQQRLTPHYRPDIPGIILNGFYSPAYEVGGDYLDYFKNEAGCWVIVIADVCGKGIPAALLMTLLRSAFRVEARNETSARRLLASVNTSMQANLDDRSFVTALCCIVGPDGTSMSYARAGHPRIMRIRPDYRHIETYRSDGIALGILPDMNSFIQTVDELTIPLVPGDFFFIYTDGLTDAFDPVKNTYGSDRLHAILRSFDGTTPRELIDNIIGDIKLFTQNAPYHDDLTLIAFAVNRR